MNGQCVPHRVVMISSTAFVAIGNTYNCEVIDGVFRDENKKMSMIGGN